MRWRMALILVLGLAGCTRSTPPPWQLLELGQGSVPDAIRDQWVMVEADGNRHWLEAGEGNGLEKLSRDLRTLPEIACGDVMRLAPGNLPLSIRHSLGLEGMKDSLTVKWNCLDQAALAAVFLKAIQDDPLQGDAMEDKWVDLLRTHHPETDRHSGKALRSGDEITLLVSTVRADGQPLEPETVRLTFNHGDADQVVEALEPGLLLARSNSTWSVWARSGSAFGQEAHPDLGLPAHMPLRFSVRVE